MSYLVRVDLLDMSFEDGLLEKGTGKDECTITVKVNNFITHHHHSGHFQTSKTGFDTIFFNKNIFTQIVEDENLKIDISASINVDEPIFDDINQAAIIVDLPGQNSLLMTLSFDVTNYNFNYLLKGIFGKLTFQVKIEPFINNPTE
ncbi:hypothetical protein WQ54_13315 [Bacillus sp. SA1-12]|uniref:hypothetical protein n=1 Tax=Bacillus sp. SA1-12 TaxID=1455638 RepID=UPI00062519B5|nr:hypothetical protein [Bacillus sp. SA1-12]KKI91694.1 hypothetical protein WQ54_13315 [Bacillus sp. SA1-12]